MKSAILLNFAWLGVATGAFFLGRQMVSPKPSRVGTEPAGSTPSLLASTPNTPARPMPGKISIPGLADDAIPSWLSKSATLSNDEMAKAMAEVMSETDPLKRSLLFSQLLNKLTPENAKSAWSSLNKNVVGFERMQTAGLFLYAWGTLDGASALKAADENSGFGGGFMKTISISGWASKDPDKAIAWLNEQKDGNEKANLLRGLVNGLARTDSKRATDYVLNSADENSRRGLIGTIAEAELKKGFGSAEAWAKTLPTDDLKSEALTSLARNYVNQDSEAAKKWAATQAADPNARGAVGQITESMIRQGLDGEKKDVNSTLDWVNALPDGQGKLEATRQTFQEWARRDPTAASAYLRNMPATPAKDNAVAAVSREVARDEPMAAIAWAQTIRDESLRLESLQQSYSRWAEKEPDAAQQWLGQQNFSPDQAKKITQPPPQERRDRIQGGAAIFGDWMRRR